MSCLDCGRRALTIYWVHDSVWTAAGMTFAGGHLHMRCLEKRLGRRLEFGDFSAGSVNALVRRGYKLGLLALADGRVDPTMLLELLAELA